MPQTADTLSVYTLSKRGLVTKAASSSCHLEAPSMKILVTFSFYLHLLVSPFLQTVTFYAFSSKAVKGTNRVILLTSFSLDFQARFPDDSIVSLQIGSLPVKWSWLI